MRNNLKKNIIYSVTYEILQYFLPLITTPYLARVIGVDGIGIYSFHHSIAYYFFLIAKLGLNNYGNRSIAEISNNSEKISKTFCSIYSLQFITSLLLSLAYLFYCIFFESQNVYSWILFIYVISSLFDINWLFFGLELFNITVTRNIIIKIVSVLFIFIFVNEKDDLIIYTLILAISPFISNIVLWRYLKKYVHFYKPSFSDVFLHLKPNLILFIPIIAISVYKMMDKTMLGIITNYKYVGYYENSEKILNIPSSLITAIGTVMLPRITNIIANNDKNKEFHYFNRILFFTAAFSSIMCFGIMACSTEFVKWYFGDGYEYCAYILLAIMPSSLFLALANVIRTQIIIPHKMDNIYIYSVCSGALINFILNILLICKYNAIGAAIATVFAELIVLIIQLIYSWRIIKDKNIFLKILPFYLFGAAMFIIIYNINISLNSNFSVLVVKAILGFVLYFIFSIIYIYVFHIRKKRSDNINE